MSGNRPYISDETLLGYLIQALPEEEQKLVEQLAQQHPEIRQRLEDMKSLLDPIDVSNDAFEPRAGLASDTMDVVRAAADELSKTKCVISPPLNWSNSTESTRIAWGDSLVSLAAGIIILSVLLPTVFQWREAARRFACSEKLRLIGTALYSFAELDGRHRFPSIDRQGPLSFAGVYAIRLKDSGQLGSPSWLWCPSNNYLEFTCSVPTSRDFIESDPMQQRILRYNVGGNFAYNMGYILDGEYVSPRLEGRRTYAVIGDMWPENFGNVNASQSMQLHGENGANVLFEDGRIQLIKVCNVDRSRMIDNPFLNRNCRQAVGIDRDDSCLGPSYWLPFADCEEFAP